MITSLSFYIQGLPMYTLGTNLQPLNMVLADSWTD